MLWDKQQHTKQLHEDTSYRKYRHRKPKAILKPAMLIAPESKDALFRSLSHEQYQGHLVVEICKWNFWLY